MTNSANSPQPPNRSAKLGGKAATIILFLFSLPFIGVGVTTLMQVYRSFVSNQPNLIALLFLWMFGLVFFLVGTFILIFGLFGKEVQPGLESPLARRKRLMGIKPLQEQWKEGRIRCRGLGPVIGGWLGAAFSLMVVALVLWVSLTRGYSGGDPSYHWWIVFSVFPILLITRALYRNARWSRYGNSICELHRRPSTTSGEFKCFIRTEGVPFPAGDATIEMRCEKRQYEGSGKNRQLRTTILWKDQKSIPVTMEGLGVMVDFSVPADIPEAADRSAEGIFWILTAACATPGVDYKAVFDLAFKRVEQPV